MHHRIIQPYSNQPLLSQLHNAVILLMTLSAEYDSKLLYILLLPKEHITTILSLFPSPAISKRNLAQKIFRKVIGVEGGEKIIRPVFFLTNRDNR